MFSCFKFIVELLLLKSLSFFFEVLLLLAGQK